LGIAGKYPNLGRVIISVMVRWTLAIALTLGMAAPAAAVTLAPVGTFAAPVGIAAPPGDAHRVFVVEIGGAIRIVDHGVVLPDPFLTLGAGEVQGGGEQGLLALAFAPDYATSGRFYVYFTAPPADASASGNDLVLAEGLRSPGNADQGVLMREVLRIPHRIAPNHNGGHIAFGPDGLLYLATGDGGDGGHNGQDLSTLLGKVLRIDPAPGGGCGGGCTIPASNPFASAPEVFAYGLRNPYKFSFDRATGDLAVADVGQSLVEEVSFERWANGNGLGGNFGWNHLEGSGVYSGGGALNSTGSDLSPDIEHTHGAGWCAVVGGYVARDPALPALLGRYVYGDFCVGSVYSADPREGEQPDPQDLGLAVPQLSAFGEDGCGRVYAASLAGAVFRLAESGECAEQPPDDAPPATEPPAAPTSTPPAVAPPPASAPPVVAPPRAIDPARIRFRRARVGGALVARATCAVACRLRLYSDSAARAVERSLRPGQERSLRLRLHSRARRALLRRLEAGRPARVLVIVTTTVGGDVVRRLLRVRVTR
jgi:hypothetical protein